jgi:two-component system, OmpR family, sensor kinase
MTSVPWFHRSASVRWRVAAWAIALMVVCLAVAFVAVYRGTGHELRGALDRRLSADATHLSAQLEGAPAHTASSLATAARRYIAGRPFSATSTMLFVRVPTRQVVTNRPELFDSTPPDNGESEAEQEAENRLAARLPTAPRGYSTIDVPDIGDLRLLVRVLRLPGATPLRVVVGAGEPLGPVTSAQHGVARAFVLAAALAIAGALLGGVLLGAGTARPLRRMAAVAGRVDSGELHHRIHIPDNSASEVVTLAHAFDHMLDRLAEAFGSQREFIADASHELRTPLTVIRGQLEVLAEDQHPSAEEVRRIERLLQTEVSRIDRLVEDLLLLAELDQSELLQPEPVPLEPFIVELWDTTTVLAERRFELGEVPAGTLRADPDRLAQALRNLLTNAIKHTHEPDGHVSLRLAVTSGDRVRFVVEDDGPGIPDEEQQRVFDRFHRLDPARARASGGAGLGLAIVEAIARAHGGTVKAGRSRAGGAQMELELPGFAPEGL